jgi:type IV secretory pathway VirB10-like protein
MSTTTLRERRHQDATNALSRVTAQRDACLTNLVRYEAKLKGLRRQVERLARAIAAEKAKPVEQPKPKPKLPDVKPLPLPQATEEPTIPDFLRRTAEAKAKDAEAAEAIRQEQAERKTAKARGRIAKLKAAQAGDTKRMPLTGKAALAAIRG